MGGLLLRSICYCENTNLPVAAMGEEKEKKKKKKKKGDEEAPPTPEAPSKEPSKDESKKSSKKKSSKKKSTKKGSGVFAVFPEKMLREFKEGFTFMDHDKDGILGREDIRRAFDIVGKLVTDKEIEDMINDAPVPISFTMFLTMFAERMSGEQDDDDMIIKAFRAFDVGDGSIEPTSMRNALKGFGDRFSDKDCDEILSQLPQMEKSDNFDINGICEMLTSKPVDEEETEGEASGAE